jgi:hypothetical protein
MTAYCVGYVCTVPSECITDWSNELSSLSPEKKAEWRSSWGHVKNTVLPVRWNAELAAFEIKVNETVKTYIKTEKAKDLFVMFPEKDWAPIVEDGCTRPSANQHEYYYPSTEVSNMSVAAIRKIVEKQNKFGKELGNELEKELARKELQKKQSASSWGTWSKLELVDGFLTSPQFAPSPRGSSSTHNTLKSIVKPGQISIPIRNAARDEGAFDDILKFDR